jgi:hypothetical protein
MKPAALVACNRCRDGSEIPTWWIHDGFVRRVAGPQYYIPDPDPLRCTIAVIGRTDHR